MEHKGPLESYATFAQPFNAPGGPDYEEPDEEMIPTTYTKKSVQAALLSAYHSNHPDMRIRTWQDKPNTFAMVTLLPGTEIAEEEFAFAKCSGVTKNHGPDVWDAEYGRDLAIRKAIAKHAKRIVGSGESYPLAPL